MTAKLWSCAKDVPTKAEWLNISNPNECWIARIGSIFNDGIAVVRRHDTIVYTWVDIATYGITWAAADRTLWRPCHV